jgi:hypothetical protein
MPTHPTPIQHSPGVSNQSNKARRRNKRYIGKKIVKVSLFADDMILYFKDSKNSTQKLDTINIFSNVAGYKINLQNSIAFLYTNNEQIEKEYMKTIPFTKPHKNQIPRNKLNKRCKCPLQGELQTTEERD